MLIPLVSLPPPTVMKPLVVTSTRSAPLVRSSWTFVIKETSAFVSTRLTPTVTLPMVTVSLSVIYAPPLPADAVSTLTVVSICFAPVPIPPLTALSRSSFALTFTPACLILTMEPLVLISAALPLSVDVVVSTYDTSRALSASKRAFAPLVVTVEPSIICRESPALTSIVALTVLRTPVKAWVPVVAASVILPLALSEMLPVSPSTMEFSVMSPLRALRRILPEPLVVIPVVLPPPLTMILAASSTSDPVATWISL